VLSEKPSLLRIRNWAAWVQVWCRNVGNPARQVDKANCVLYMTQREEQSFLPVRSDDHPGQFEKLFRVTFTARKKRKLSGSAIAHIRAAQKP
jgi:hypothetical protein